MHLKFKVNNTLEAIRWFKCNVLFKPRRSNIKSVTFSSKFDCLTSSSMNKCGLLRPFLCLLVYLFSFSAFFSICSCLSLHSTNFIDNFLQVINFSLALTFSPSLSTNMKLELINFSFVTQHLRTCIII